MAKAEKMSRKKLSVISGYVQVLLLILNIRNVSLVILMNECMHQISNLIKLERICSVSASFT